MNHRLASRLIVMLLIGILFGLCVHSDQKKWSQLGRQAYIDHELADFDSSKAQPQPAVIMVIGSVIVTALFFGIYELIVWVFSAVFKKLLSPAQSPQSPPAPVHHPFS